MSEANDTPRPVEVAQENLVQILRPFERFIEDQRTSSLFLLGATVVALTLANSALSDSYEHTLHIEFGFLLGEQNFSLSLSHWINDGLMVLFFFLLGLEIKREILTGELDTPQTLAPVAAAALGGMLLPAAIFLSFTAGTEFSAGWGIPMATDAAFAIGILAMLGKAVPKSASAFLVALAIIDDLGAILVIAIFYSNSVDAIYLGAGLGLVVLLFAMNLLGVKKPLPYLLIGVAVWIAFLNSGVHATVAGVLVALTIPTSPHKPPDKLGSKLSSLAGKYQALEAKRGEGDPLMAQQGQLDIMQKFQQTAERGNPMLARLERAFEIPVALLIVPIFALANAGIPLSMTALTQLPDEPLALGILVGLLVGKAMGISLLTWLTVKFGIGKLPEGLTMAHVLGLGLMGGIGFTMSIFIANLGFENNPELIVIAKTAVLLASLLAGVLGFIWLRFFAPKSK